MSRTACASQCSGQLQPFATDGFGDDQFTPSRYNEILNSGRIVDMNTQRASREDTWTVVFFYITILVSMALIAIPTLRTLQASKLAIFLMTLGMVAIVVRRESKRRTLGLTIQQIYAQAKLGRKFAPPALELAATVVWCWAMMVTY